ETDRRREVQRTYNEAHGIVPRTTRRVLSPLENEKNKQAERPPAPAKTPAGKAAPLGVVALEDADLLPEEIAARIAELRAQMQALAKELRYEDAARVRDRIRV